MEALEGGQGWCGGEQEKGGLARTHFAWAEGEGYGGKVSWYAVWYRGRMTETQTVIDVVGGGIGVCGGGAWMRWFWQIE